MTLTSETNRKKSTLEDKKNNFDDILIGYQAKIEEKSNIN